MRTTLLAMALLGSSFAAGCGGSDSGSLSRTPYDPGYTAIVSDQKTGKEFNNPTECTTSVCTAALDQQCGPDQAADVIVDEKGNTVEVVCYSTKVTVDTVPVDQVATHDAGNNTVLVLDGVADGDDVTGDVTISGNNAIVYGSGPDTSVIGGTVQVDKNNAKIRGVRIKGNVTIDKNDTKLLFCVIEGDLTITGNNTTVAECEIWGKVTNTGNNTVFAADRFAGVDTIDGQNVKCINDVRFDDASGDGIVQDTEVGGAVTCGGKAK